MSSALRSVLFFRVYRETALPLYTDLVAELCRSRQLPFQLATTLEDIGQGFMKLAEQVNSELIQRGILDQEGEADQTVEAQIDATLARLSLDGSSTPADGENPGIVLTDESFRQALRIALVMTHGLPVAALP